MPACSSEIIFAVYPSCARRHLVPVTRHLHSFTSLTCLQHNCLSSRHASDSAIHVVHWRCDRSQRIMYAVQHCASAALQVDSTNSLTCLICHDII